MSDTVAGFEGLNVAANSSHRDIGSVFVVLQIERTVHPAMWNTNFVGWACVVVGGDGVARTTRTEGGGEEQLIPRTGDTCEERRRNQGRA